ncbi:diguanylate cyclase [Lusitaniella coriacea LEGE 07157]|uniref:Diguanylate cyclase n=1 Tax=Lusitaniella coriacea LEGE 07157 TaxID=945747 RepID=A0A8J7IWC4_9CYAN|nr:diguanylate cyclase [Lusitaniella coriacea]MBE9117928.1 diguanylate cyclase [Lusitaniella coriacea LEGE 07157]
MIDRLLLEIRDAVVGEDILVVDDTPANLNLLTQMLSERGYTVRVAPNGHLALKSIRSCQPSLILLDIKMPDLTGYQVCARLKIDEATRDIPIIFISALDEVIDKVKAFEMGAVDYITKPFEPVEVLARIKSQLRLRSLQLQLQQQNLRFQQEIKERHKAEAKLQKANLKLTRLANSDGLTQVANRRLFNIILSLEWVKLRQAGRPLGLVLCDVDYFKSYNDIYGHLAGDDCLRQIASSLRRAVKQPNALVARYGGEEFAILLPNNSIAQAVRVAESIRDRVRQLSIPHKGSQVSQYVTISLGVSSMIPVPHKAPELLIDSADRRLYAAKQSGRDRAIAHEPA